MIKSNTMVKADTSSHYSLSENKGRLRQVSTFVDRHVHTHTLYMDITRGFLFSCPRATFVPVPLLVMLMLHTFVLTETEQLSH